MSTNELNYSRSGLQLTEGCEALRTTAYKDAVGVWTIGYGHTGSVFPGMTITPLRAEQFLLADVQAASHCVNQLATVVLSQPQFDALVDLVFNIGSANFAKSTLLKRLNLSDFAGAAQHFADWDEAKGQILAGLVKRRATEMALFTSQPAANPQPEQPN